MAEVQYNGLQDTQKQQIKDVVATTREYHIPTYDSFSDTTRKIVGGQQGYQIPFYVSDYGQNSYLSPGSPGNSFVNPIPPESVSMYVGLAYPGAALLTDGTFMDTMDTKASLIKYSQLRWLRMQNYMKHLNYYAIGDNFGYGILAVTVTNTGGTFTGTTAAATTAGQTKGAHRLLKGVTYDVVNSSTLTVTGTMTPTVNGEGSATVTCTTTGTVNTAGAYIVEQGAFNKVPRGLAWLINNNDRTFQGLDTTNYVQFNSSQVDLNGSALTSATVNTIKTKVQIRANTQEKDFNRIVHLAPGQWTTLCNQGFAARQYQAANGQATTSYGYPENYIDGDCLFVVDADMDEDRVYFRRRSDYFKFVLKGLGTLDRDGLTLRQSPGTANVGADAWFENIIQKYNFGFDGGETQESVGNGASALIIRAALTSGTTQVTAF